MAEAHSAVAFSFAINPEGGLDVKVNRDALLAVWNSGVRAYKKRLARFKNSVHNGLYPAKPSSWLYIVVLLFVASLFGWDLSHYGVASLEYVCRWWGQTQHVHLTACVIFSLIVWLSGVLLWRLLLVFLFSYQSWMYEPRGTMRLRTKIWLFLLKYIKGTKPRLYAYQSFLPRLPVPSIDATLKRHLRSVRPLMNDAEYEEMVRLSEEFKKTISFRLQLYLVLKSWWSSNYVSDWWEDYIYLAGRSPIMINSNFYGLDTIQLASQASNGSNTGAANGNKNGVSSLTKRNVTKAMVGLVQPAARAANIVHHLIQHRKRIDRQELQPIFINNTVPLCSMQYERQFNTVRLPGEKQDQLKHFTDSYHIAVYHRGRYYKCYFKYQGRMLTPIEMQTIFEQILSDTSEPSAGEEHLAALTAGRRPEWYKARKQFFSKGINCSSLEAIEKAAFFLTFDDESYTYDPSDHSKLDDYAHCMLHGKGYDRWFDKSFTIVVGRNGKMGFNGEHSWADAPIMGHLWEYVIGMDFRASVTPDGVCGYTEDGNCIGTVENAVPGPIRLHWDIPKPCIAMIEESLATAQRLIDDTELHLVVHDAFGKGAMKSSNVSPDAFLQLALQLACYRVSGRFYLTYESSMTRLFKEGRTETIRSCTNESCAFVKAMMDPEASKEERMKALYTAAEYHQEVCRDAMTGKGIDRHLFALYVMDHYLGTNSPFLKKVLQEPWRLSTSQTPSNQINIFNTAKYPEVVSAGGGFGPVADDGYGVSYIIYGENVIFFHISCKKSCPTTDAYKFGQAIREAMAEMRATLSK